MRLLGTQHTRAHDVQILPLFAFHDSRRFVARPITARRQPRRRICNRMPSTYSSYFTEQRKRRQLRYFRRHSGLHLTLSPPITLMLYNLRYWSNPPFLIFDIRALWRPVLSARALECQKNKNGGLDQYGAEPFKQQQF